MNKKLKQQSNENEFEDILDLLCLSYFKYNVNQMKATDRVHQLHILRTTLDF